MACNSKLKNKNYKSCVTTYNNATQSYVTSGTTLNILGSTALDSGCSINAQTSSFEIENTGTYRVSYDVTSVITTAGIQILQLYNDTVALPCAIVSDTVTANTTVTQHIETTIYIPVWCAIQPNISCQISGTAGDVTHICANVTRVA